MLWLRLCALPSGSGLCTRPSYPGTGHSGAGAESYAPARLAHVRRSGGARPWSRWGRRHSESSSALCLLSTRYYCTCGDDLICARPNGGYAARGASSENAMMSTSLGAGKILQVHMSVSTECAEYGKGSGKELRNRRSADAGRETELSVALQNEQ